MTINTHVFICDKCKKRTTCGDVNNGSHLIKIYKDQNTDPSVKIHSITCLGLCVNGYGISASISHTGKQTMLLGELSADDTGVKVINELVMLTKLDPEGRLYQRTISPENFHHYKYRVPANPDDKTA